MSRKKAKTVKPELPLQDVLDPGKNGRGILILREISDGPQHTSYYVDGGHEFAGRTRWVRVAKQASVETAVKAIRDELAFP